MEVEQQGHCSRGQIGALLGAMERLHVKKNSVLVIDESIHHVGGTGCLWELVGFAVTRDIRGYP